MSRRCWRAPRGWYCSLLWNHSGPCPARPRWWNLTTRWRYRRAL